MLDKSFLEKIEEMADVKTYNLGGVIYSTKKMNIVPEPLPEDVHTSTLESVVTYAKTFAPDHIIHVVSPREVRVISYLSHIMNRCVELVSDCVYKPFRFNENISVEQFIIAIQAQFVQDETTAAILRLVGNLTASASQTTMDDGVTQTVTAKAGITRVENVAVPNPVTLRPFRTFIEVEQPASKFVFRLKANHGDTPQCALYEADGGAWEIEAIAKIAAYLREKLPEAVILS